jgi:cofilin
MASGIKIDDEVKIVFQQISLTTSKSEKKTWAKFKFQDDLKKIVVEACGTLADCIGYDNLISSLPCDDVRYVVFDFEYINKDNCRKSDLILISWHPDGSSVRKKMICASSLNALKGALCFNRNIIESDNYSECDSKAALEKVGGKAVPT